MALLLCSQFLKDVVTGKGNSWKPKISHSLSFSSLNCGALFNIFLKILEEELLFSVKFIFPRSGARKNITFFFNLTPVTFSSLKSHPDDWIFYSTINIDELLGWNYFSEIILLLFDLLKNDLSCCMSTSVSVEIVTALGCEM